MHDSRFGSSTDGRSLRWEEHREQRRLELMDSTVEAVRIHGANVSMDQIAAVAKTSKTIIYKYFADKAGLQVAIGRRFVSQFMEESMALSTASSAFTLEPLVPVLDAFFKTMERDPELYFFVSLSQREHVDTADVYLNLDPVAEALVTHAIQQEHPGAMLTNRGKAASRAWTETVRSVVIGLGERWLRAKMSVKDPENPVSHNFDDAERELAAIPREELVEYLVRYIVDTMEYFLTKTIPSKASEFMTLPEED